MSEPATPMADIAKAARRELEQDPRWGQLTDALRDHVVAATVEVSTLPDAVVRRALIYYNRLRDASRVTVNLLTYHAQQRSRLLSQINYDDPKVRDEMRGELAIAATRAAHGNSLPPDLDPAVILDNNSEVHKLYVAGTLARDAVLGALQGPDSASSAEIAE